MANRSSSPAQTRPSTKPNLRASETNSSIRRSFTGNPFPRPLVHTSPRSFVPNTPANSPAEFGRKLSVGKDGSLRGFEEKENEKVHNLKPVKCKSPLKASKNFMSPTISAASKFTPSPRKKILGERNEAFRTSISFSDGQESSVSDFDSVSDLGFDQKTNEGSSDLAGFGKKEAFKSSKRVTFSDEVLPIPQHESSPCNSLYLSSMSPVIAPNEVSETPNKADKQSDYDSVILDSSLDLGPFSSPTIAPLDADPSFPPYDPKTNYLSPRPQFLRYKPNRRVEDYLSKEGLNFEENKEFEDTDVTEETESGDSQKESEDGSTTETLPSEEEALLLSEPTPADTVISDQMLKRIFEANPDSFSSESEEEELMVSEPILTVSPISNGLPKQIVEAERAAPQPGFFTRTKCISLILMLFIACVSVSFMDVSITSLPVIKDLSFYKLYESSEVAALARKKVDRLPGNFQNWYESTEIAARENFDGLLKMFQQWYESSDLAIFANKYSHRFARGFKQYSSQAISYLSELISRLGNVDKSISLQFCNLTDIQEHSAKVGYFEVNRQKKVAEIRDETAEEVLHPEQIDMQSNTVNEDQSADVIEHNKEEKSEVPKLIQAEMYYPESDIGEVFDLEQFDTPNYAEIEDQLANVNEHNKEEKSEVLTTVQAEMYYPESNTGEVLDLEQFDTRLQSNTQSKDQSVADSPASEAKSEVDAQMVITPTEFVHDTEYNVKDRKQFDTRLQSNTQIKDQSVADSPASEAKSEVEAQIVISPTELVHDTDYSVTDRNSESKSEVVSEVVENKAFVLAILGISFLVLAAMIASTFRFLKQRKNITAVNVVTNPEMSGESCPSAMSTFQNTSSHSKGSLNKKKSSRSQERKPLASASTSSDFSTGSPSYGSFTTYERRIPLKHAYGEEEIVTPVRRSSRIRSQITSS